MREVEIPKQDYRKPAPRLRRCQAILVNRPGEKPCVAMGRYAVTGQDGEVYNVCGKHDSSAIGMGRLFLGATS